MSRKHREEVQRQAQEQSQQTQGQTAEQPTVSHAEHQELIGHLQRLQAEFDNYRKRVEREQQEARRGASEHLLRELLSIQDNLDLAITHAKDEHGHIKGEDLLTGVLAIKQHVQQLLEHQGVAEIPATGKFDPYLHEALLTVEGTEKGMIVQTLQRGYTLGNKILRPARVSVAK
jgi:molecular chaperone GrpE